MVVVVVVVVVHCHGHAHAHVHVYVHVLVLLVVLSVICLILPRCVVMLVGDDGDDVASNCMGGQSCS